VDDELAVLCGDVVPGFGGTLLDTTHDLLRAAGKCIECLAWRKAKIEELVPGVVARDRLVGDVAPHLATHSNASCSDGGGGLYQAQACEPNCPSYCLMHMCLAGCLYNQNSPSQTQTCISCPRRQTLRIWSCAGIFIRWPGHVWGHGVCVRSWP